MAIDCDGRVPPVEDVLHHATDLGCLQLHGVAVQVEELPVVADAHTVVGAHLVGAVLGAELLVAVGIEDGANQEHHTVKDIPVLVFQ